MKDLLFFGMSLLLVFMLAACNNNSKSRNETQNNQPEGLVKEYYKRMEGSVDKHNVVLHLVKYQSLIPDKGAVGTDHYSGIFLNVENGMPLDLSGYKLSDSIIQLVTYDHYNPVDTFKGSFSKGSFNGVVTDTLGQRRSFSFKELYPDGSYHWSAATYSDSLFYDSSKKDGPIARTDLMTLWPGSDISNDQKALFSDTISLGWFGMNTAFTEPEALLKAASDTFLRKYGRVVDKWKQTGDGRISASFNWNELANMDMIYNADSMTSLRFTQYQFTGGAHGLQSVFCMVVDMKKNRVLRLSDIFKEGYERNLRQALEKELRKQYDIPQKAPLNGEKGILFDAHLSISSNFYLTGEGIGFIYNPYEVAPYVVGKIDLYIPYSQIPDILRK